MAQEGNPYLREMGPGMAASKCKIELRSYPKAEAAYEKYQSDVRDQLKTMDGNYRAIGPDFIHAKLKS